MGNRIPPTLGKERETTSLRSNMRERNARFSRRIKVTPGDTRSIAQILDDDKKRKKEDAKLFND